MCGAGGWGVGDRRTYRVRMQEASTALISRERKPPLSRTCKAWMVAPPGEQTLSLSWPGCCSESRSILAAPYAKKGACGSRAPDYLLLQSTALSHQSTPYSYVPRTPILDLVRNTSHKYFKTLTRRAWAPRRTARRLGSPIFTPPSARASRAVKACGEVHSQPLPFLFSGTQNRAQQTPPTAPTTPHPSSSHIGRATATEPGNSIDEIFLHLSTEAHTAHELFHEPAILHLSVSARGIHSDTLPHHHWGVGHTADDFGSWLERCQLLEEKPALLLWPWLSALTPGMEASVDLLPEPAEHFPRSCCGLGCYAL